MLSEFLKCLSPSIFTILNILIFICAQQHFPQNQQIKGQKKWSVSYLVAEESRSQPGESGPFVENP